MSRADDRLLHTQLHLTIDVGRDFVSRPQQGVGMELTFSSSQHKGMGLLRVLGVVVVLRVDARRHLVRHAAHFLHDVDLATHRPGIGAPVVAHRHHPEGGPCALTLRQLDASLEVAVLPALIHVGIDAA